MDWKKCDFCGGLMEVHEKRCECENDPDRKKAEYYGTSKQEAKKIYKEFKER